MSGAQEEMAAAAAAAATAQNSYLDASSAALGLQDRAKTALFEFRVFNITITALALCFLVFTGLYCITVCINRNRQWKRAHAYESAVTRGEQVDPVAVRAVKRSTSFINPFALFRRPEVERDAGRIYYIYSNPLPVGLEEEEEEEREQEGKRLEEERREQEEKRMEQEQEEEKKKKREEERKEKREQGKRAQEDGEGRRRRRAPCGLEEQTAPSQSLLIRKYAEDPNSGVTLDPPMFYMQL